MHHPLSDKEGSVKRWFIFLDVFPVVLLIFCPSLPPRNVQAKSGVIEIGKFSAEPVETILPRGWTPLTIKKIERHTSYTLVKDGDTDAVKASANASASGLIRKI